MKKNLPLLLLITPLFAFSQTNPYGVRLGDSLHKTKIKNTDSINEARLSGGITFQYELCNITNHSTVLTYGSQYGIIAKPSISLGINCAYKITERVSIEIGLALVGEGYQTKLGLVDLDFAGQAIPPTQAFLTQSFYYVGVPVKVNYTFFNGKNFNWFITGGLAPCILIDAPTTVSIGQSSTSSFDAIAYSVRFNMLALAGVGFTYKINHRAYIKIQPVATIVLLPEQTAMSQHLYSFGLEAGIYLNRKNYFHVIGLAN